MDKLILNKSIRFFLCLSFFILNLIGCEITTENLISHDRSAGGQKGLSKLTNSSTAKRIELLTSGFAKLLRDQNVRNILYSEILASKKVENILEASELLSKNIKLEGSKRYIKLEEALVDIFDKKDKDLFKELLKNMNFGEIDIYFPVEGHLEAWGATENLLIAGIPPIGEANLTEFVAYDLKGREHILSIERIPTIPTLIIYPSEKRGHYYKKHNAENSEEISFAKFLQLPPSDPPPPPDTLYNYKCEVIGICIKKEYDPWPFGKLEIYFKVKAMIDGGVWTGWFEKWGIDTDPGHWNYSTQVELYRADKNFSLQIEIWEDDQDLTGADDFVADAFYNRIYKKCDGTNLPTNIIRCDYTCTEIRLEDGIYPSNDDDLLDLTFHRWQ